MGEKTFNKYTALTKLFWMIFRPLFVKAAASSETPIDDAMIEAADTVMSMDLTFDDINL